MIENKRGHIVAISSLGGKVSFAWGTAYCATKFGIRGFMNSLYDELCLTNDDRFIKTTTVFPYFINTRKELTDILDQNESHIPRMTPEYVANEIIAGILVNKRDITLPRYLKFFPIFK